MCFASKYSEKERVFVLFFTKMMLFKQQENGNVLKAWEMFSFCCGLQSVPNNFIRVLISSWSY